MHADHITGTGLLKKLVPGVESVISKAAGAKADVYLEPGDHIKFGNHQLEVRGTPGHTSGCVTYVSHEQGCAFTGKYSCSLQFRTVARSGAGARSTGWGLEILSLVSP